jgi:hypothetical protein
MKHDDVLYIAFFICLLVHVYLLAGWWSVSGLKCVAFKYKHSCVGLTV